MILEKFLQWTIPNKSLSIPQKRSFRRQRREVKRALRKAKKTSKRRKADIYFFVNASTVELPTLERFIDEVVGGGTPAVAFNLELDTLRSDLGLFGFPPKALHYTFLSQFLPVYYIRQRDYSKTIAEPPFVCNYR